MQITRPRLCLVSILFVVVLAAKKKNGACPPFPHAFLENGNITVLGVQKYGLRCDPGYFLTSPGVIRCWRGAWSSNARPTCLKAEGQCENPPSISGGEALGEERHVDAVVQYVCYAGYVLLGNPRRICLQSGHWSGVTPACMDESEPLQTVAERMRNKFVTDVGAYSSDSVVAQGRMLDSGSIRLGLELVILIDRSSSVDPQDFKIGIEFVKFLLQEFGVRNGNNTTGTRAAVITFGTEVDVVFNVDNRSISGPLQANQVLDTLQANGGGTAMEPALMAVFLSVKDLLRENAKKAVFLITDGEPNIGSQDITTEDVARLLKSQDFEIFTVGIGRDINRKLLADLASEPVRNHVFILDKYSDLISVMKIIKDKPPEEHPISDEKCGYIKKPENYLRQWPWLAALYIGHPNLAGSSELSFCSGTLICKQWVLTAAACFYQVQRNNESEEEVKLNLEEVFVVLGERNLLRDESNQMNFYATDVRIHPDFNPMDSHRHNNLALLKLNIPAPSNRFRTACLPPTDKTVPLHLDLVNTNTSIAGWGLPPSKVASEHINGGTVNMQLSSVPVTLSEEHECRKYGENDEKHFCAGSWGNPCVGDLGSPIMAVDPATNLHHVIGVLSKRSKCQQLFNNQYTELTEYLNWITRETKDCHFEHWTA